MYLGPLQWYNCKAQDHTKLHCLLKYSCVKCSGAHTSDRCFKVRSLPAKCTLSSGTQSAFYKGCPEYKNLATISKQYKQLDIFLLFSDQSTQHKLTPTSQQTNNQLYLQIIFFHRFKINISYLIVLFKSKSIFYIQTYP